MAQPPEGNGKRGMRSHTLGPGGAAAVRQPHPTALTSAHDDQHASQRAHNMNTTGKGEPPHTSNGYTTNMPTTGKGKTPHTSNRQLARRQGRVGGRLSAMTRHPSLQFKRPRALSSPQSPKPKPYTYGHMPSRNPNPIKGSPGSSRNTHNASYFW